ncbi:hypothetical protein DW767_08315 [Blautia obeum]|jgi:hypothetical protein|uniref:Uncharacterized protein n=2 Tax=Blautia obeum TaxID=40520 RepID=A0A396FW99_9FIRM|nr:hypothetical protein [Blautia obeum]RGN04450.1 hypothetical protein DXB81_10970 [Blautia obeum]RGV20756.1 hypothetical protein DWW21_13190 [Blautia obeum]RGV62090.1 hypothetical protein DWW07_13455 [Blautia obeum]RHE13338.1 hypothetical protein DW767_08315 [Blautia obeum]RHE69854.1 hypothetical protein DW723_16150 [Blautia obeum]
MSQERAEEEQKKFRRKRRSVMSACTAVIEELHQAIVEQRNMEELEGLLWAGVLAYQNQTFYTLSGLEFSYMVKHKKNGDYSGELLISRKETSKTLTRSSVMLAFHKVLAEMKFKEINGAAYLLPPEYRGPKSIGQIFGISYIFSMFLEFGLIRTNEKDKIEKAKAEKVR